jgi:hypothetical protein
VKKLRKKKMRLNKQLKIINKATDMALEKVEQERKDMDRNYITEWFRYIEITSKELSKYLN